MATMKAETGVSFQNLLHFVRINFLVLLVWLCFSEMRNADGTYWINWQAFLLPVEPFNILVLDWIPDWMPHSVVYELATKVLFPLGMIYGFIFPQRRAGYVCAFGLLFCRSAFEHSSLSVIATFCLVPMLLLSISPPRPDDEGTTRARLAVAFSAMYLLSALSKLNVNFLSGTVFSNQDFNILLRPWLKPLFAHHEIVLLASWGVLALQVLGSLLVLSRYRKIALYASVTFHFLTAITIMRSFNILLIGASLVFLFAQEKNLRSYYRALFTLAIFSPLLLFAASQLGGIFMDGIPVAFALGVAGIQFVTIHRLSRGHQNFYSPLALVVPIVYALLALIFSWPEPLGYTQYSGRKRSYYAVKMTGLTSDAEKSAVLRSRWSVRFQYSDPTSVTAFLPSESMLKPLIKRMCVLNPDGRFRLFQTPPVYPSLEDLAKLSEAGDETYLGCSDWNE